MNQSRFKGLINLSPEPSDGHIDHIGITVKIDVPDLFRNEGAREDFARVPQEKGEQGKLLRGQIEFGTTALSPVPQQVNLQIGQVQNLGLARRAAPQEGLTR